MKLICKLYFVVLVALVGCSSGPEWQKSPVDILVRDLSQHETFSIILFDMDVEGSFSKTYKHQYKIVTLENDQPQEKMTEWYEVSEQFFMQNQNNMGMEVAAKSADGKISKTASPPGYSSYVGNPQYGQWNNHSGGSFWEFYGKYAMMSSLFNMMTYPAYRNHYSDYRSNYYGRRAYYGPKSNNGSYRYGTNSAFSRKTSANSRWRSKASNRSFFSNNRSSGSSWSNRTSRSSSRYSSGSGFRSRGGGFGK